ncbi:neogenin-like [Porites lutea]|uniref:neogenin-like n=1 Tax=Porites lutea TaxID=51062 RepID=UPI003CC50B7C
MASFVRQGAQSWTLFLLLTYTLTQVTGTQSSNTPSGCTTASSFLGMTNRKIRDADITASSELDSNSSASNARLNNTKSWVADKNDTQPWIEVNLGKIMNITAISIQGLPGSGFVSSFYFSYDTSEREWLNYTIHGGLVKVFQGNTNDNGTRRVLVNPLVTAQYIRLHPTNCSGHCALRMEFYGCKSDPTIGLPGQPLSLKQISISSSMINITWDHPIDIGDGIKGYTVKWQEVNGTSGSMQKVVLLSIFNAASLTVTPYTWYDIHVQAYNDEGIGPWSKPLRVQSSESVPSAAPANFRLSSSSPLSLTASWDAIPVKQQQGKLLGYQVFYKKEGSGNEQNGTAGPDQLKYTIMDLEFASYSFRVAGFTAVGIGDTTVVQTKTPNEGG